MIITAASLVLLLAAGCMLSSDAKQRMRKTTYFIGIDVSGSFIRGGDYEDALRFAAYYIYGHVNSIGELNPPKALFVAPVGGFSQDEPKSFRPIHDFESKSVDEIEADLKEWLVPSQTITDFNAFFYRVKKLIQKKNLILTPINIVILTDGVPSRLTKNNKKVVKASYKDIDLSSLEYLARNITVRLLYPVPVVAEKWESEVPRNRVRMWTVDNQVMKGWKEKVAEGKKSAAQDELWKWVKDNVDYRVRRRSF